jgi:hypothetical protein
MSPEISCPKEDKGTCDPSHECPLADIEDIESDTTVEEESPYLA